MDAFSPELRLLTASARAFAVEEGTIRTLLERGIDWTRFARKATNHEVACLCGSTLARVAPDLVPQDVLEAFGISIERTRTRNQKALDELVELNEELTRSGVEVIALRGPVLAIEAFGDLGLRAFGRCDFLVRESEAALVSAALHTAKRADGAAVNVRSTITSGKVTIDLGWPELRRHARPTDFNGRPMLTPSPEDGLLVLAIHGAEDMWWRIKRACDVAAFIGSHPDLDWKTTIARAREIGCPRMLALALSLAGRYFGSNIPQIPERAAQKMGSITERIVASWEHDAARRGGERFSADLLRLHSGTARRGRYLVRAALLPRLRDLASRRARRRPAKGGALSADNQHEPAGGGAGLEYAMRLYDSKRFGEAVAAADEVLRADSANLEAMRLGVFARHRSCDWRRLEEDKRWLAACAKTHPQAIREAHLELFELGEDLELAGPFIEPPGSAERRLPEPSWRTDRYRHPEIRIAYVSASFCSDPMAALVTGVLEHHDKERFNVTAISLGRNRGTPMHRRIEAAASRFIQADKMCDAEIARTLRDLRVDIAVDLNGYTGKRSGVAILAHRPAPVQINLGYTGRLALPYIDYVIADRVVILPEQQSRFGGNVVYLPHSFQPNDCNRPTASETPSRAEVNLPSSAFVFACFNTPYKITPTMFDIWMRLLQRVESSVLWLLEDNVSATVNLRREARVRGIDPRRLVFAPRIAPARHQARQRLADLFLDTLPMNAHATASDALWAGLPVLTCIGNLFRSRVAASLLHAVGLPELVTSSLPEYEQLALGLAHDVTRLDAIKAKLIRNRLVAPLFDTPRYTRHLEAAYAVMWQRSRSGLPPVCFAVDA